MWTTESRPRYNRDKLRYQSGVTDAVHRMIFMEHGVIIEDTPCEAFF
jgi:hypothetical protein